MKPLKPKDLFSNTILTPISKTASMAFESSLSEMNCENWQTVNYKKKRKKRNSPLKPVSASDDPANKRKLVGYGVKPDGTYKWSPKDDFDLEDDSQDMPRSYMTATREQTEHKSVLQRYLDKLDSQDIGSVAGYEVVVPESPNIREARTPFHAPSLKLDRSLLDDDVPVISKVDYSRAFFGIDPVVKQKENNEGSKQKVAEKSTSLRQKENESAIAAADLLDDQL